ncbi:MAG: hypothetical protein IT373_05550 [Polyangiaceae bacterium]|nr:hypothetical protein [Polyangiaceae bacterium]
MKKSSVRYLGPLVAVALGALGGCSRKGQKECDAYLAKDLECGAESYKGLDEAERKQAADLVRTFCLEAMAGDVRGAPNAEVEKMANEMLATLRGKVACASAATCEAYRACEQAVDAKPAR